VRAVQILPTEVVLIDQLALPQEERYVRCGTWQQVAERITDMTVRGAPAIGVAAAGALHLAAREAAERFAAADAFAAFLDHAAAGLLATRPTAVNLAWAVGQMRPLWRPPALARAARASSGVGQGGAAAGAEGLSPAACAAALYTRALQIHDDDVSRCLRIGEHGAGLLRPGDRILTHCNAGALATAGYGTALGVIRSAYARYGNISVLVDETRPWLQGARLTAWELQVEGIPYRVIADNMAGYFLHTGEVDAVVVGADRIAANGDTANKIGTYSVAVLAVENNVPFYVAAPLSTVDASLAAGGEIPIEERSEDEVLTFQGRRVCPPGARARHPAFDVTPAAKIAAIITEAGVLRPPYRQSIAAALAAAAQPGAGLAGAVASAQQSVGAAPIGGQPQRAAPAAEPADPTRGPRS
jgi:methylthioribose-1-phosphate isomerase